MPKTWPFCDRKRKLIIGIVNKYEGANYKPTVKILKFGTPQTIAIIVLKIEKFDVTLH